MERCPEGVLDSAKQPSRTYVRMREFSKSLPMSLLRAREAVMLRFRSSLRMFNITEQQWRILRALTSISEIEVTALAHATFLLPPSLSRILKDLEERELVSRRADPEDLRRNLVSITPSGVSLMEMVAPHQEGIYSEITTAFGAEKLQTLQALLRDLEATLGELSPVSISEDARGGGIGQFARPLPRGRPRKGRK